MKGIRRILIINGKGGCGKTTIATNLAIACAQQGKRTALLDYDSQASSTDWSELRLETEQRIPDGEALVPVRVIPTHKQVGMYQTRAFRHQLSSDIERVIIDTPSGARERDIDTLIRQCDVILVPMLSSPLDIRSGSRFIAELLTHRAFRTQPRSIGVIANRLQHSHQSAAFADASGSQRSRNFFSNRSKHAETGDSAGRLAANQQKLMHALECLNVPCVAHFTDSALYGRAAEEGKGITELQVGEQASLAEQARWVDLVNWVEAQPKRAARKAAPPLASSTSAPRNSAARAPETSEQNSEEESSALPS